MRGQIADEVRRLGDGQGEDARERVQRLHERKDALAAQVQALEEQLDRMAGDTRTSDAQASRALREAASGIRENKLKEKIRYSKGVVRGRPGEPAQQFEGEIGQDVGPALAPGRGRSPQAGAKRKATSVLRHSSARATWCSGWSRSRSG
jgi:hypothetical protein